MTGSNKRTEREWIDWLRTRAPGGSGVELGIGDDAAVLSAPPGGALVFASDLVVEGVHFGPETEPALVGRKALARNLSDLAAMGARPWAAVVSAMLPRYRSVPFKEQLFEGIFSLARRFGMAIVGGDLAAVANDLAVDVAVLGLLDGRRPLTRSGAREGDVIVVTGELGGSLLGHHLTFEPRVEEALALVKEFELHAAIDISDGLLIDLDRLVAASGVGACLDLERIPVSAAARDATLAGGTPLDHALRDGEDYELILVMPEAEAVRAVQRKLFATPLTIIGRIIEGAPRVVDARGQNLSSESGGYQHQL